VLLLSKQAAHGLDIQHASHVILMEPIWDASLERQVIGRAHRLGAATAVTVDLLVGAGTFEETILRHINGRRAMAQQNGGQQAAQAAQDAVDAAAPSAERVQPRQTFQLNALKLIRN